MLVHISQSKVNFQVLFEKIQRQAKKKNPYNTYLYPNYILYTEYTTSTAHKKQKQTETNNSIILCIVTRWMNNMTYTCILIVQFLLRFRQLQLYHFVSPLLSSLQPSKAYRLTVPSTHHRRQYSLFRKHSPLFLGRRDASPRHKVRWSRPEETTKKAMQGMVHQCAAASSSNRKHAKQSAYVRT